MSINDYANFKHKKPLILKKDEPVENVIHVFARNPELRGIFIVDENEEFYGVITRFELLQWIKYKLVSLDSVDYEWKIIQEIKKYVLPTRAYELVNRASSQAYVFLDDSIEKALRLMADNNLIDIPILDSDGKIIADIKLSDLLDKIIKTQ